MILFFIIYQIVFASDILAAPLPYNYKTILPLEKDFDPSVQYQTDLYTGAATYTYEIKVPPGTNELQPTIDLRYNHHLRNSPPGIVGAGWRLTENYIQRNVNSTRDTLNDDEFNLVFDGASYDLVKEPTSNRYHTKIENFLYIEQVQNGSLNSYGPYWIVKTKDGTLYRFGFFTHSERAGTENNLVWRWSLDTVTDLHANTINYTYLEDPFGDTGTAYLDKIEYNNDRKRLVDFIYENTTRQDLWDFFNNGNRIKELRRLREISIHVDNTVLRRYELNYDYDNVNLAGYSFLAKITEFGTDNKTVLPPVFFQYYPVQNSWTSDTSLKTPECDGSSNRGCFVNSSGSDNGVRLIDVNRDGFTDLVWAANSDDPGTNNAASKIHTNTGGKGWKENPITYPECQGTQDALCFVINNEQDFGTRFGDLNNDGLIDIVNARDPSQGGPNANIYIHQQTQWVDKTSAWSYPLCGSSTNTLCLMVNERDNGVLLVDVNGDGFDDIVKAEGTSGSATTAVYINNGATSPGWTDKSSEWNYPKCTSSDKTLCLAVHFSGKLGVDNGVRLVDINGDGLADIIKALDPDPGSGVAEVQLNTGKGWTSTSISFPKCNSGDTSGCITIHENGAARDGGIRLVDMNGDGLVDVVRAIVQSNTGSSEIWFNNGNGWTQSTAKVPQCDGGGNFDGCFVTDGGVDQSVRMADLNGDGIADSVRAYWPSSGGGLTHVYTFDGFKVGFLKQINHSSGGTTYLDYKRSTYFNNSGNDSLNDLGFPIWAVDFKIENNGMTNEHKINATTHFNYTGGIYEYTKGEFRGFRNVTEFKSTEVTIKHNFYQDDGRQGREFNIEIINQKNNSLFQKEEFYWNSSFVNGSSVVLLLEENSSTFDGFVINPKIKKVSYGYGPYGNILRTISEGELGVTGDELYEYFDFVYNTTAWIVDTVSRSVIYDAGNTTKLRETKYSYDGLSFGAAPTKGDVTKEEKILASGVNPKTTFVYDSYGNTINITNANGRTTQRVFGLRDTTFTFPDQEINALGRITNRWHDLGTGNVLAIADPNNFVTNFTYDTFGRASKEIQPFDSFTYPTKNYTYYRDGIAPEWMRVEQRETNATTNTYDTFTVEDGLGNIIQTKADAENGKQIVEDIYYDSLFRVSRKSNKYLVTKTEQYSQPSSSVKMTNLTYDVLDRVLKIQLPDGTERRTVYARWNETQYDENNNQKIITKDAYDRIITVIEFNPGSYTTQYRYNSAGDLLNVTDNLGNILRYTYDLLSRKTSMLDPDLNLWNYTYDNVSNVINIQDKRGITVNMSYDVINRLVKKTSGNKTTIYRYDVRTKGALTNVEDNDYIRNYTYDQRLRRATANLTINGRSYFMRSFYDSLNRITKNELSLGENITYTYSDQNVPQSIAGIVSSITHNELGSPIGRSYANNEMTNFTYDPANFRLTQIKTGTKQDLRYIYTNVSDVASIRDEVHNRTYNMTYDSLSRLLTALRLDHQNVTFNFTFTYNSIGNMLNISSPAENFTYFYNGTPAHAPYRIVFQGPLVQVLNSAPVVSNVTLTATSPYNATIDNLTVSFAVTDGDQDNVYNTTDWRVNNKSIAVLNMPFNAQETSSASGAVKDISTSGYNGTLVNTPLWISNCKIGGCYDFDFNDSIDLGTQIFINSTTSFTYAAWISVRNVPGSKLDGQNGSTIIGGRRGDRDWFGVLANGSIQLRLDDTTSLSASNITFGTWHHTAVVYNYNPGNAGKDTTVLFYIDGVFDNNVTPAWFNGQHDAWTSGQRWIGWESRFNSSFNGTIDEVMIFNRTLSAEQIYLMYQAGKNNRSTNTLSGKETQDGEYWSATVVSADLQNASAPATSNAINMNRFADLIFIFTRVAANGLTQILEFVLQNNLQQLNSFTWQLLPGNGQAINSTLSLVLNKTEASFIETEYSYSTPGNYTVTAIATNGTVRDVEMITIEVTS